ncbi:hypothetical protein AAVH_29799 [Aphelenchoides avenae]|nr:hypothetical protein AAVH_29799 [Aphelenchus avenae]
MTMILVLLVVVEYMMGRPPICTCGYVKLFEPHMKSGGNSQHIADWYTPTHMIHGFILYGLTHLIVGRKNPWQMRLFIAVLIEVVWEIAENSPPVIARFRSTHGYAGDSILNSFMDVIFMSVGFLFAWGAPVWVTVAVAVSLELITAFTIRDNFVLQVLMLIYPVAAIKRWQDAL